MCSHIIITCVLVKIVSSTKGSFMKYSIARKCSFVAPLILAMFLMVGFVKNARATNEKYESIRIDENTVLQRCVFDTPPGVILIAEITQQMTEEGEAWGDKLVTFKAEKGTRLVDIYARFKEGFPGLYTISDLVWPGVPEDYTLKEDFVMEKNKYDPINGLLNILVGLYKFTGRMGALQFYFQSIPPDMGLDRYYVRSALRGDELINILAEFVKKDLNAIGFLEAYAKLDEEDKNQIDAGWLYELNREKYDREGWVGRYQSFGNPYLGESIFPYFFKYDLEFNDRNIGILLKITPKDLLEVEKWTAREKLFDERKSLSHNELLGLLEEHQRKLFESLDAKLQKEMPNFLLAYLSILDKDYTATIHKDFFTFMNNVYSPKADRIYFRFLMYSHAFSDNSYRPGILDGSRFTDEKKDEMLTSVKEVEAQNMLKLYYSSVRRRW